MSLSDITNTITIEPEIFKSIDSTHPYTVFCDGFTSRLIHITLEQALALEIILNKTDNARPWITLGDILFEWRIDPNLWLVKCDFHTIVSEAQFDWITNELSKMR
jgi:hypothetical protein